MSRSRHWRSLKASERRQQARAATNAAMEKERDYSDWSHESLITRVTELEKALKARNSTFIATPSSTPPTPNTYKKGRSEREFDPSKYSTRLVAFKLAYLGRNYNGFEHHANNKTPLPTIEEELWKAFNKARLIFPKGANPIKPGAVNWEGCEYSKCGRTDKGVSAFGQVIGIRVRSNRPLSKKRLSRTSMVNGEEVLHDFHNTYPRENALELASPALAPPRGDHPDPPTEEQLSINDEDYEESLVFDPIADEIPYVSLLNRILPPDIRILAWCPAPPLDFSARFSCRERQYKYFFTQPAFVPMPTNLEGRPVPGAMKDGWLDIAAMREAAQSFVGLHDFRNFCKVDPGKQISNFDRKIYHVDIEEHDDMTGALEFVNNAGLASTTSLNTKSGAGTSQYPKVYSFNLNGSAFLWHQVRHIVAILFLVGQKLEPPSIVSDLLDVKKNPRRPMYEMATDTPLVLWNCVFPRADDPERKEALQWQYAGDGANAGDVKYGSGGLMEDLWKVWKDKKTDEVLAGTLLGIVSKQGGDISTLTNTLRKGGKSQKVFDGGDVPKLQGTYLSVMKKPRLESVEVINHKFATRKGFESAEDLKAQGYRRPKKDPSPLYYKD